MHRRRAVFISLMLPLAIALAGPVPVTRASDDAHNIPGVPLPAAAVAGQLGGKTFDVVYRVDVSASYTIVLSMTGTAGTDYDLYLFDSRATNIYADPAVGEVASSTGPTSTEYIRYTSSAGGEYYIDLSAYAATLGTYHLAVQLLPPTTPVVAISLDGGAPATNNPLVAVTLVTTEDRAPIESMSFSFDETTWTAPEPYSPTPTLSLDGPDGVRNVWVRVMDEAGVASPPAHATIVLDRVVPTVVSRWPGVGATVGGLRPTITVRFSKAIQPSTWLNAGLILQDANSTIIYGNYAYDSATFTGMFTPAVPLQPGATYVISVGSVTDIAGNKVAASGSWTFTPLIAPTLTLTAGARVVKRGQVVDLAGSLTPVIGGPLVLEGSSESAAGFVPLAPLPADPAGNFSWSGSVETNTSFRADCGGSAFSQQTYSSIVRVLVRREVLLAGVDPATTRRIPAYTRQTLTATVSPALPAVPVTLSIYRYVGGRGYVLSRSVTRTARAGRYAFSWTPSRGRYYIRLATAPTPLFANGVSPVYRYDAS